MYALNHLLRRIAAAPAQPWILATLVRAAGSSYRRRGARLLVGPVEGHHGTISGGCLEGEIAKAGRALLAAGDPPTLRSFDTRLLYGCDGQVDILIEVLPAGDHVLHQVAAVLQARQSCTVRVGFAGPQPWGTRIVEGGAAPGPDPHALLETLEPPVRLLVFGNGPEIPVLRALVACLGWDCQVFAQPDALPPEYVPDQRTGAVVMNHHFGRDCATLDRLLPGGLRYVALLGPKRRREELLARLAERGRVDGAGLAALYAPAGLDLGGEAPEEIAFSIVAEAMAVFGGRSGGFLRDRRLPIHDHPDQAR